MDPYPCVVIPVLREGKDMIRVFNRPKYSKSVHYFIDPHRSATDVISFYIREFAADGWTMLTSEQEGGPHSYTIGTENGPFKVRHQVVEWVKPALKLRVLLALRYSKPGHWEDEEWEELQVIVQVWPLVDGEALRKFVEKVLKSPEGDDFRKLIQRYRGDDGNEDLERAVRENPDNPYLRKYKELAEQLAREMEKAGCP